MTPVIKSFILDNFRARLGNFFDLSKLPSSNFPRVAQLLKVVNNKEMVPTEKRDEYYTDTLQIVLFMKKHGLAYYFDRDMETVVYLIEKPEGLVGVRYTATPSFNMYQLIHSNLDGILELANSVVYTDQRFLLAEIFGFSPPEVKKVPVELLAKTREEKIDDELAAYYNRPTATESDVHLVDIAGAPLSSRPGIIRSMIATREPL